MVYKSQFFFSFYFDENFSYITKTDLSFINRLELQSSLNYKKTEVTNSSTPYIPQATRNFSLIVCTPISISTDVTKTTKIIINKLRTSDIIPTHSQKDFRPTSISRMESKKSLLMTKELMTVFQHFSNPKIKPKTLHAKENPHHQLLSLYNSDCVCKNIKENFGV